MNDDADAILERIARNLPQKSMKWGGQRATEAAAVNDPVPTGLLCDVGVVLICSVIAINTAADAAVVSE